ncbi:MAG TPA: universal stress protein [Candidatus Aphodovivens avistercoris]|nr:universal stress protein [Candidatus Aphodovivens avistercoris]
MWFSKALVAYDGSEPSKRAIEAALDMAQHHPEAKFVFAHVLKLPPVRSGTGVEAMFAEDAQNTLADLQRLVEPLGERAETRMLRGTSPADVLIRGAQDEGCDLIIMGSRGRGGVAGYLGSVSYAVVQESPINVLVAK